MIYMDKKKEVKKEENVSSTRLNPTEIAKRSMDSRLAATEKALKCEKVRYNPKCDTNASTHKLENWKKNKYDSN